MRKRLLALTAILLSFALLAAACGDDDDAETAGTPEPAPAAPEAEPEEPEEMAEPEQDMAEPEEEMSEPEQDMAEPEQDMAEPEQEMSEPQEEMAEPEMTDVSVGLVFDIGGRVVERLVAAPTDVEHQRRGDVLGARRWRRRRLRRRICRCLRICVGGCRSRRVRRSVIGRRRRRRGRRGLVVAAARRGDQHGSQQDRQQPSESSSHFLSLLLAVLGSGAFALSRVRRIANASPQGGSPAGSRGSGSDHAPPTQADYPRSATRVARCAAGAGHAFWRPNRRDSLQSESGATAVGGSAPAACAARQRGHP